MNVCICTLLIIVIFLNAVQFSSQQPSPGQRRAYEYLYNRGFEHDLRNAKYPSSPPRGFASLKKLVEREYVNLDENTILVEKGSFTVGWNDGRWVKNLYNDHEKLSVYDHILHCVTELDDQLIRSMGTNVQAPKNVPEDSFSSHHRSFESDSDDDIINPFDDLHRSNSNNAINILRSSSNSARIMLSSSSNASNIVSTRSNSPSKRRRTDGGL